MYWRLFSRYTVPNKWLNTCIPYHLRVESLTPKNCMQTITVTATAYCLMWREKKMPKRELIVGSSNRSHSNIIENDIIFKTIITKHSHFINDCLFIVHIPCWCSPTKHFVLHSFKLTEYSNTFYFIFPIICLHTISTRATFQQLSVARDLFAQQHFNTQLYCLCVTVNWATFFIAITYVCMNKR